MGDDESLLDTVRRQARSDYEIDRYSSTVEMLSAYLIRRPEDAYMWFLHGDSLRCLGRWKEAERSLQISLDKSPAEQKFYVEVRLARLYDARGSHKLAETWYARAANRPDAMEFDWFWILRGANFANLGLYKRAEECHRRAVALESENLDEAFLNLGLVLRARGNYELAAASFRDALEINNEYEQARAALESLEGVEEAIEFAKLIS